MRLQRRIFLPALLALGSGLAFLPSASAQVYGPGSASLNSYVVVGAGNLNTNLPYIPLWSLASKGDPNGAVITVSANQSFSGNDSDGNPQTMTFTGSATARAEYGVLHTVASGEVDNPYYNATNSDYYDGVNDLNPNGSPQYLLAAAHATFQDTLTLNPLRDPIVKVRYLFHVDGNSSDPDHTYAVLGFSAGNNSVSFFTTDPSTPNWATPEWDVTPGSPIPLQGDFAAVFGVNTNYYNTPEGQTVNGTADYYDTLTLTGIQLLDANGNQVNGVSYLTASGTHYNVLGGFYGAAPSVPEPGSLALLAGLGLIGATCGLKFRRSRS